MSVRPSDLTDSYSVRGDLTIRGVVEPVELTVTVDRSAVPNIASVSGALNRFDFGIGQAFPANLASAEISISAELIVVSDD
jgi:polyisoprenoid-binding protein YceI